jgi:hypothetical protein
MSALERAIQGLPKTKATNGKMPAAKTFRIEPQHFADTWENKPIDGIELGIGVPSEADVQGARIEAIKVARNASVDEDEDRIQIFNDTLMCCAVASAICDPNNVSAPHPFFDMAEDLVPLALKPKTIQYIFDLVEALHVEQSPVFAEISPEEETRLSDILTQDAPYAGIERIAAMKARRYLRMALDILEE